MDDEPESQADRQARTTLPSMRGMGPAEAQFPIPVTQGELKAERLLRRQFARGQALANIEAPSFDSLVRACLEMDPRDGALVDFACLPLGELSAEDLSLVRAVMARKLGGLQAADAFLAERARKLAQRIFATQPETAAEPVPAVVAAGPVTEANEAPGVDRGECVKRNALIERNRRRWVSIERDLKDASSNGLSKEARANNRPGFWWEGDALKWAEARNKLGGAQPAPVGLASVVHRMAG